MNNCSRKLLTAAVAAALSVGTVATQASEKGDFVARTGLAIVAPANSGSTDVRVSGIGNTGTELEADTDLSLGLTFTYMLTDTWGLGLLAAYPFTHDIQAKGGALAGLGDVAETKHLPPTLTLQYHPKLVDSNVQPYLGIGVNYTYFFDEDVTDPTLKSLGINNLDLDNSWGLALEAGMDIEIKKNWLFTMQLWYADIDTTAKLNGPVTRDVEVDIDPLIGMFGIGYKF